jgi:hypothetical protein
MNIYNSFLKTMVESELNDINDYIKESENYLTNRLNDLRKKADEMKSKFGDNSDTSEYICDRFDGDYYNLTQSFQMF